MTGWSHDRTVSRSEVSGGAPFDSGRSRQREAPGPERPRSLSARSGRRPRSDVRLGRGGDPTNPAPGASSASSSPSFSVAQAVDDAGGGGDPRCNDSMRGAIRISLSPCLTSPRPSGYTTRVASGPPGFETHPPPSLRPRRCSRRACACPTSVRARELVQRRRPPAWSRGDRGRVSPSAPRTTPIAGPRRQPGPPRCGAGSPLAPPASSSSGPVQSPPPPSPAAMS